MNSTLIYRRWLALALIVGVAQLGVAAIIGTNSSALPLTTERIANLPRKEQSAWKKYLAASQKQHRADQAFLVAELRAHHLEESTPAPKGGPESRLSLQQPRESYGQPSALRIADIVVSFQTPAGGWCKGVDMVSKPRVPGGQFFGDDRKIRLQPGSKTAQIVDWNFIGTFDNNATITQLRYLAKVISALSPRAATPYRTAFLRGLDYIFAAQYPNGGWPQVWPLQGDYHDAITYNDNAMVNVLELLRDIATGDQDFLFVPARQKKLSAECIERGIACLLKTQITLNGQRTVWCQQHDALNLTPTAARNYEMPSASSAESSAIMSFLMKRAAPSPEIVAAIHAAAAWFDSAKITGFVWEKIEGEKRLNPSPTAPPLWARYYDLTTHRPIFGDRDKSIHDDVREISLERRNGYSWFSVRPDQAVREYEHWRKSHPTAPAR